MLLRISFPVTDWIRLASGLEAAGSPVLAGTVRTMVSVATPTTSDVVALQFTPEQAGGLQKTAASLGLRVLVTPVAAELAADGWTATLAERAEAVAAADALLRSHHRRITA